MYKFLIFLTAMSVALAEEKLETARDLRVSMFSEDGNLIRKFTALSASGPLVSPIVEGATVEFYGDDTELRIIAVLDFTNAIYERTDEIITGDGNLRLTTEKGVIAGRGFRCDLTDGRLDLQSKVTFESAAIQLAGDRANIDFETEGRKKEDVIRNIEVTGNIVVERKATVDAPFDRAECTFARFSAEDNKVFLKTPVSVWRDGEKIATDVASGFLEIDLNDKEPSPESLDDAKPSS